MQAQFLWQINAVDWVVQAGWLADDGQYVAAEFTMDEFARRGHDMVEAFGKAVELARTLVAMRAEGGTVADMDTLMQAIAMDGGL